MHTDPYFFAGYDAEFGADQGHPGGVAAARETTAGSPKGESRSLGKLEKDLPSGSPEGEADWAICESNAEGRREST